MNKWLFLAALASFTTGALAPALSQTLAQNQIQKTGADDAPFEWRLRLRAGQKWLTTTETSTRTSQQMPKMPGAKDDAPLGMETLSKSRVVIEQNVVSSDENGARVEMIYREMTQSSTTRQGDKIVFDSANPPAAMKGMTDISQSLVGAKISYLLGARGEISDIQGVEATLERLNAGAEKGEKEAPETAGFDKIRRETLAASLSPEAIKTQLSATYQAMPARAIAPGGTWKFNTALPVMGTTFTQNGENTFVSRQNGVVSLAEKGVFFTDAGAQFQVPLPISPGDSKAAAPISQLDLRGTSSGEIRVDEPSGMTLSSRTSQKMEGELVMSGLTGKGSTLVIPMKLETQTVVTTEEIKVAP